MTDRPGDARDRSIPELLRDLATETGTLVRQEVALARVELTQKIKPVQESAGLFGATAIFGLGAFGALTACLIAALAIVLDLWAAALIVAIVYGVIAVVLLGRARATFAALQPPLIPTTVATVKEDVAWIKTQNNSAAK